jgi:HSP20 family molecular chaperone IbpA
MSSRATATGQEQGQGRRLALPISTGESLGELAREVRESVGRRAYDLFEARGREHGQDLADWFRAETELIPLQEQVSESKGEVKIEASLARLADTDLHVGVDVGHVIVTASRKSDQTVPTIVSANVISLPAEVDPSRAVATSDGHTLRIDLPKQSESRGGATDS